MNHSLKIGFSFGFTSSVITTLGLIMGLSIGTGSRLIVIGGILTIAFADSFSDAMGIHVSEEAENVHSQKEIWQATGATFASKFIFTLLFVIPFLLLPVTTATIISIVWGLLLLTIFSYYLARLQKIKPRHIIFEHLTIAVLVIVITYFVGQMIETITS